MMTREKENVLEAARAQKKQDNQKNKNNNDC